ncbi:MAG: beta-lactamase family protein [Wenzhouxiangella sp.]|nr:beta-lactamase family protein [Wenzhouxiangella sp.]MCH8477835.1 beta-lactamase family protein [Wenzhouxiangella sp.]TVR98990.1 MAG: class A beta-lactamase-related serine hydrolase [Wenzhouxiangellaceae bacterium]
MKRFFLVVFLMLVAGHALAEAAPKLDPASIAGLWQGTFEPPSGTMRFDVELDQEDESWQATVVLHSEGGARVPADRVELAGDRLSLVAMQGAVVLEGRVDGDQISGSLRFPTSELDMRLYRAGSELAADMLRQAEEGLRALREQPLRLVRTGPGLDRVDAAALDALLALAEASFTTALALLHDGELVGEWFRGAEPHPIETMSVTKVALQLIIGRLVTLGKIETIDAPVYHYFPQWADDQQRAGITLRQLMTHSSGLDRGQPAGPIYQSDSFVQFALDAPMEFEPGTSVAYSNNATNLLAGVLVQVIDQPLETFLANDLFGKLGIERFSWVKDRAGTPHGMAGLSLHAADLAVLGQLALNRGRWGDQQLIDPSWFEDSFQPGSEHSQRIGLLWFLDYENEQLVGASHSGYLGQWLGIRFDSGIVGARQIAQSAAYDAETDAFPTFLSLLSDLPASHEH